MDKDGNETESLENLNSKNFIDILKLNKIDILDVKNLNFEINILKFHHHHSFKQFKRKIAQDIKK